MQQVGTKIAIHPALPRTMLCMEISSAVLKNCINLLSTKEEWKTKALNDCNNGLHQYRSPDQNLQ